jgi:septum formation inhibitor MinC
MPFDYQARLICDQCGSQTMIQSMSAQWVNGRLALRVDDHIEGDVRVNMGATVEYVCAVCSTGRATQRRRTEMYQARRLNRAQADAELERLAREQAQAAPPIQTPTERVRARLAEEAPAPNHREARRRTQTQTVVFTDPVRTGSRFFRRQLRALSESDMAELDGDLPPEPPQRVKPPEPGRAGRLKDRPPLDE